MMPMQAHWLSRVLCSECGNCVLPMQAHWPSPVQRVECGSCVLAMQVHWPSPLQRTEQDHPAQVWGGRRGARARGGRGGALAQAPPAHARLPLRPGRHHRARLRGAPLLLSIKRSVHNFQRKR